MPSPKSVTTPRHAPRRRVTMIEDEPSGHGFPTGHDVLLSRRYPPRKAAPGPYKVIAQLPARDGQFQYRIKSGCEPFYRTIAESEIERT
jgi:hypothetical protein